VLCNELAVGKGNCNSGAPVFHPSLQRGFWVELPGRNLSVLGADLQVCWFRFAAAAAMIHVRLIFMLQDLVAGHNGV